MRMLAVIIFLVYYTQGPAVVADWPLLINNRNITSIMTDSSIAKLLPEINPKTGLPYKSPWFKRAYKLRNREKILVQERERARNNTLLFRENTKKWRERNRERYLANRKIYKQKRHEQSSRPAIEDKMRKAFYYFIKNSYKKSKYEFGANSLEIRGHLERQFTELMSWENWGAYWHIDHIKPIRDFDLTDPQQAKAAFHYLNTRPLEKFENIRQQPRRKP